MLVYCILKHKLIIYTSRYLAECMALRSGDDDEGRGKPKYRIQIQCTTQIGSIILNVWVNTRNDSKAISDAIVANCHQ